MFGNYRIFEPNFIVNSDVMVKYALDPIELIKWTEFHESDIIFHLPVFVELILLGSIVLLFKKKLLKDNVWIFILIFTVLSAIMTTNIFPWKYAGMILSTLQFPWRLCIYIFFGAILITGIGINHFKDKKYFNIMCVVLIILATACGYYYIGFEDRVELDVDNPNLRRGMGNEAEYLPFKTENLSTEQVFFVKSGKANIYIVYNDTPNLIFDVDLEQEVLTEIPRIYYPGYKLECDGEEIELSESERGFLQAKISNSGRYYLSYDKTFIMKISLILSMLTLLSITIYVIWNKRKKAS